MQMVLGKRLPITAGTLELAGVSGPVRISRDALGVAYVNADSDTDAWFGLGFAHGQDRAFQLESIPLSIAWSQLKLATMVVDTLEIRPE
jgi:penicillin amidase